jgi:hypothetical protein
LAGGRPLACLPVHLSACLPACPPVVFGLRFFFFLALVFVFVFAFFFVDFFVFYF